MRRVEALALALAIGAAASARGADPDLRDPATSFLDSGLTVRSEIVRHQKHRYLLIRIEPASPAALPRDARFRPVTVACDRMTVQTTRGTLQPELPSLCRDATTLRGPKAPPLFVAFRDPGRGDATLSVPVRVLPPVAPVMTSLERERRSRDAEPPSPPAENRTLTARIRVPD
jgi:hypothetical protein